MRTTSLDILEKAQLPGSQAKAILKVMELELEDHRQTLATHADLAAVRAELAGVRTELKIEIAELRAEMRAGFAELRSELRSEMHAFKVDIIKWVVGLQLATATIILGGVYFIINHAGS